MNAPKYPEAMFEFLVEDTKAALKSAGLRALGERHASELDLSNTR